MADYIPNGENFEIDVILGNLDIDASTKKNLKKATESGNSFVCIYCEKQYLRQKPYQMHFSVCCKERKVQVKEGRYFYCFFVIVVDTHGFTLG